MTGIQRHLCDLWHQLSANQQPAELAWQPKKNPHSHAEQRHITMETLTHTLTVSLPLFPPFFPLLIFSSVCKSFTLMHSSVRVL